ncbi:MAG: ComF family protein [Pseudomonadota bacterium]
MDDRKARLDCFNKRICSLCGVHVNSTVSLCSACLRDLPLNEFHCSVCSLPLTDVELIRNPICGRCIKKSPAFDQLFAPFRYDVPCDFLVTQFKYNEKLYIGPLIGALMGRKLSGKSAELLLAPVPLHEKRLASRGFNQSDIIAKSISKHLGFAYAPKLLKRVRDTPTQQSLNAKQRARNLRNAFVASHDVRERQIAVIDDVATTGATAHELARTLKKAGATRVEVWAFARAARN